MPMAAMPMAGTKQVGIIEEKHAYVSWFKDEATNKKTPFSNRKREF